MGNLGPFSFFRENTRRKVFLKKERGGVVRFCQGQIQNWALHHAGWAVAISGLLHWDIVRWCQLLPTPSSQTGSLRFAMVVTDWRDDVLWIGSRKLPPWSRLLQESSSVSDASEMESPRPAAKRVQDQRRQSWKAAAGPQRWTVGAMTPVLTQSLFGASEANGDKILDSVFEPEVVVPSLRAGLGLHAAFAALDQVDLPLMFDRRGVVQLQSIPYLLRGPFWNAMLMVLEEISSSEDIRRARGWKLFLLLPRMPLHRPPRCGTIPRCKCGSPISEFCPWTMVRTVAGKALKEAPRPGEAGGGPWMTLRCVRSLLRLWL